MAMSEQNTESESSSDSLYNDSNAYLHICGICLCNFDEPKALPCLHTFCCDCIRKWAKYQDNASSTAVTLVTCPNCRKQSQLSADGVAWLPTNFYVTQQAKPVTAVKTPTCTSCATPEKTSEIQGRCKECGWLCDACFIATHKSLKLLTKHEFIELESLRKGRTQVLSRQITQRKPGEGTWYFDSTFGSFENARGVAVSPNGIIAVTECTDKGIVYLFDKNGNFHKFLDTNISQLPGQISKPYGIAVDTRGYFYVTDLTGRVRVFDDNARYLFSFSVGFKSDEEVSAAGIAIAGENVIVGHVSTRTLSMFLQNKSPSRISVHKLDGSCFMTYPTDFWSLDITASDLDTFSTGNKCFEIIERDSWGKRVRQLFLSPPKPHLGFQIQGSCLTKSKELLLTNNYSSWLGYHRFDCIYRFTTSGTYLGCITEGATSDMRGLATDDKDEKLFVVSRTKVTVYRWN